MDRDARLSTLIEQWEQSRARGETPSIEELCRDCPELLEPLRERLRALAPEALTIDATGAAQPSVVSDAGLASSDAPDLPTIPGYVITAEIARGGMGRVYAGRDVTLDREVAIKTLLPGANADRFIIESKITARLPHPGIPPVHALGTLEDGTPYLAM